MSRFSLTEESNDKQVKNSHQLHDVMTVKLEDPLTSEYSWLKLQHTHFTCIEEAATQAST